MTKKCLLDLEPTDIETFVKDAGESAFRASQIVEWVYRKKADSFSAFTNLSAGFRQKLEEAFTLRSFSVAGKQVSSLDGTVRYNFKTGDGYIISAVFLPDRDRNTVCISTQAGCPVGCTFCETGRLKFKRNLTRGEILEQILRVENDTGCHITGVLFMGMGEPLLNYDNLTSAIRSIVDFRQMGLGRRHVTVSTVGIVPMIRKFAEEQLGVRLAVSLHAADDAVRRKLVTDSLAFSVSDIMKAAVYYTRKNNARLTVEYILVRGMNDSVVAARQLVELLDESTAPKDEVRVNLIPYNPTSSREDYCAPSDEAVQRFKNYLMKRDITATVRHPKGADIGSACGQLGV